MSIKWIFYVVTDLCVLLRFNVLQRGGADEPHKRRVLRHHHAAAAAPNQSQLSGHGRRVLGGVSAPEDSVHQRLALGLVGDAARLRGGPVKKWERVKNSVWVAHEFLWWPSRTGSEDGRQSTQTEEYDGTSVFISWEKSQFFTGKIFFYCFLRVSSTSSIVNFDCWGV